MDKEFKLPDLGESIVSATIVKVLIAPGDMVKEDQTVLEIETDKATIEVPSEISGKVSGVYVKEGDKVEVGAVVFSVGAEGQAAAPVAAPPAVEKVVETPIAKAEDPVTVAPVPEAPVQNSTPISSEMILPDLGDTIQ